MSNKAVLASLLGLAGAGVIIGGKLGGDYSANMGKGMAAILVSAVLYAYNLILQRQQALVAKPFEIAFFQNGTVGRGVPVICTVLGCYALLGNDPGSSRGGYSRHHFTAIVVLGLCPR